LREFYVLRGRKLLLLATYDNDNLHFYLNDPLGSRRAQTDYAGVLEQTCSSLPYGDSLACTNSAQYPTEHHYTGKERDAESGNDYFGARYYASSMGRFMSPDPIKLTDDRLLNPANTLNLYSYAANNPLKFVDPDGQDVTYFYDQGGIAGHAVLFAYNQQTGDSAIESFGPVVHAPIAPGESMFDMSSLHSADDVRSTYASLTIQTSPELAQQVIAYIRANPDPSTWTAVGPNCSTQCIKILQKFKLANQKDSGLRPKLLWNTLRRQYNPNAPANPKNGTDYGNPRTDMFNALWLSLPQAPKDNSSVTVTVTNCVTDSNGQKHCDTQ
jgi:RHS repeat-associated protein